MKIEIKECKPFGTRGSHIIMGVKDLRKKFLVLSEDSRHLFNEILESLKISLNPKISEVLDEKDIETIEKLYKEKIERIDRVQHKNFLKNSLEKLREINVDGVGTILDDLDGELPERLKRRLMAIYYKKNE